MNTRLLFNASAVIEVLTGVAMLVVYNIAATALFVYLGTTGAMNGLLLWPAAALHLMISLLLLGAIIRQPQE